MLPPPGPGDWPDVPQASEVDLSGPSSEVADCALRILVALTPCAFITSFVVYAQVIRTMVDLALRWPASPLTPLSWTNYGLTLCGVGRQSEGFDASELALTLSARHADPGLQCKVRVLSHGFLRHWRLPAAGSAAPLAQAYEDCLVYGEQEYLGYAAFLYCDKAWATQALDESVASHRLRTEVVRQFAHDFSWTHCRVWLQAMLALRAGSDSLPLMLDGPHFSERDDIPALERANNGFSLFTAHALRAALAWHRGDGLATRQACALALPLAANGTGTMLSIDLQVLCALSALADPDVAQAHRETLAGFSAMAPINVAHKLDLVDANLAVARGALPQAVFLFERARHAAQAQGFLRDQAMCEECCGEALLQAGQTAAAQRWLQDACNSYLRWGAEAVAERLLSRHDWLQPARASFAVVPSALETRMARWLRDMQARRIALRFVTHGETLVAEQTGAAHRGVRVRVVSDADSDTAPWPIRLLNHASATGQAQLLTQPADDPVWRDDPYFAARRPPLAWACRIESDQGATIGQAYIECNGPRLLMTPAALGQAQWHIDDMVTAYLTQRAEEKLARSRHTDAHTRVPNRTGFATLLELTLSHTRDSPDVRTVLYLLRPRNPGHEGPDLADDWSSPVLHQVVLRLQNKARRGAALGRLEHRVFGLAYISADSTDALLADARALLDALEAPLTDGHRMFFDLSLTQSEPRQGADDMITRGERLLAQATETGRTIVSAELQTPLPPGERRIDLVGDLDWAIQHGGLRLVFQPIVNMADNQVMGAEALLRWLHPAVGAISPERFVAAAERSGLIRYLGRWVIDTFCHQVAQWQAENGGATRGLSFSLNASPLELMHADYASYLLQRLDALKLDPSHIVLEVTESACLQNDASTQGNLIRLAQAGVQLCIDDFGVGMSSLGRLHSFQVRRLKIDRSFIEGVAGDKGLQTTVTMIIRLAEALQLEVVAEGISAHDDARFLLGEGLHAAQGFLYAAPLECDAMARLLHMSHLAPTPPGMLQ